MMRPLILAISLCFPSNAQSSSMCSCLIRPMVDSARGIAELRTADIVFVGKVTSVVDTTQAGGVVPFRRATFAVQLGWKGTVGNSITVFTPTGGGACGFDVAGGKKKLGFAIAEAKGGIHTKGCSAPQPSAT